MRPCDVEMVEAVLLHHVLKVMLVEYDDMV